MDFPSRSELKKRGLSLSSDNYQLELLEKLKGSLSNSDVSQWSDEPTTKIEEIEKQKEFFWIRIYLTEEDTKLKVGDTIHISYKPTNEKLEMSFGGYEKEGLNRDYNDEVINYVNKDDKKILCCMIDLYKINKESEDIPTIRTFFRNSRYYKEELYRKDDIIISFGDTKYEYNSIAF